MKTRLVSAPVAVFLASALYGSAGHAAKPLGTHQSFWNTQVGVRTAYVSDGGLDPFADSDQLVQLSLGVGRTVVADGPLSLAIVGFYDFGARQSDLRGEETKLGVHRLTAGPELRYHLLPRLYAFVRASPGALRAQTTLDDGATRTQLERGQWVPAADGALGIAYAIVSKDSARSHAPRFWLSGEAGYGWAGDAELMLRSTDPFGPERVAPLELGSLSLRGPMFKIAATATF